MVAFSRSSLTAISVSVWPWAGEVPYFDISVDKCRFFFQASGREFTVYRNLRAINASPPLDRPWPEWSIVVTNNQDTMLIWNNANVVRIETRNNNDSQSTLLEVSEESAAEVSSLLLEKLDSHCTNKTVTPNVTYKPSGLYHEYTCDMVNYSFE